MMSPRSEGFRWLGRVRLSECVDLVPALWALVCARVHLWVRPVGSLVAMQAEPVAASAPVSGDALRWARAVNRAVAYGPYRAKCLVRSLAIKRLLDAHGIAGSRVCVGVRRVGDRLAAHAWVDLLGQIVGDDDAAVRRFDRLDGLRLVDRR